MIKILIIGALVSMLDTVKPFWCAFLYTSIFVALLFVAGTTYSEVMLLGTIKFVLAFVYFWLLDQSIEGFLWWVIALVGFVLLV